MLSKGLVMFIICPCYMISSFFFFFAKVDDTKFICNPSVFMVSFKDFNKYIKWKSNILWLVLCAEPQLEVHSGLCSQPSPILIELSGHVWPNEAPPPSPHPPTTCQERTWLSSYVHCYDLLVSVTLDGTSPCRLPALLCWPGCVDTRPEVGYLRLTGPWKHVSEGPAGWGALGQWLKPEMVPEPAKGLVLQGYATQCSWPSWKGKWIKTSSYYHLSLILCLLLFRGAGLLLVKLQRSKGVSQAVPSGPSFPWFGTKAVSDFWVTVPQHLFQAAAAVVLFCVIRLITIVGSSLQKFYLYSQKT